MKTNIRCEISENPAQAGRRSIGRVALVGAECEESLPLRYLQASLLRAGQEVVLLPFNREANLERIAGELARSGTALAGFSMVFTARAGQFARLARRARALGYAGHIVAGGHFAAFNAEALLRDVPAINSVAIGEGENLVVALAANLAALENVRGLVWRQPDGAIVRNPPAPPVEDLDTLPPPTRRTPPDRYLGLPIANMLSSRGCNQACHFCSISAWHRLGGGRRWRARSPEGLADEMAALFAQGYRLFNFHDDDFLPGTDAENLARVEAIGRALKQRIGGQIGFAIKSRPNAVNVAVFHRLRELGLFRVFLGIEAGTEEALRNLGRRQTVAQNEQALAILNGLDIHTCFNLLLFNPDSTLEDFRGNIGFLRAHPDNPMNFCRTEVYAGTPLEAKLMAEGRREGSYWGYGYHIRDPRAQRAFELMHRHMFARHHTDENAQHLAMRVDYERQILADFFQCQDELRARVKTYVRAVNLASAGFLARLADFAAAGREPAAEELAAFRRDLAGDIRQREREAAALLAAIRQTAWRESQAGSFPLARIGVAASILLAAGTSAIGQVECERIARPMVPPATNAPDKASTNAPAKLPERPPDGDFNQIKGFLSIFAHVITPYMEASKDVDLEVWLGKDGHISFAALYKAGRGKDATSANPEKLGKDDQAKAEKLLAELGAAAFADREEATKELKAFGAAVIPAVQNFKHGQTDPEITGRCDQIIEALDCFAKVRDYNKLIAELKAIGLPPMPGLWGKRYLGTIRKADFDAALREDYAPCEMAPGPLD